MSLNDPISNAMSKIMNAEKATKKEIIIFPSSSTIKNVLDILNKEGYVGSYEEVKDSKGNFLKLNLLGNINKCGPIKPRFPINLKDFEKFEKRFLPSKDFGVLIISTNQGMMTHVEAKEKMIGGSLIAYCY